MSNVRLSLFGSPLLHVDGRLLPVKRRKSLALVAYLAVKGPAPRETLAGLLWPNTAPDVARHNLRQELYQLTRAALGPHVDVQATHVALAGTWNVDVLAFEDAARLGDAERAVEAYAGPLLDGFVLEDAEPFMAWLTNERGRLYARWQDVMLARASHLEAQGDLRGALGVHLALLEHDELQEQHQREAIRLHGLLGERERALERYAAFAALLADELGLEPLPETMRVADEARRGGATAPPADMPPPSATVTMPPLVGRAAAWRALEDASEPLVILLGEPGQGKSRLALAFAASFGPPVVVRAQDISKDTPLYPVADALRAALAEPRAKRRLEAPDAPWRSEVARLLPEFGVAPAPDAEGRLRFLDGLVAALLAAAGPSGAIVFEDLHWADASTLEVLAHLARRAANSPVGPRVLATARPDELPASVEATLNAWRRDRLALFTRLEPFGEGDVRELVRLLSGGSDAALFSRRLHQATGGNPLFVLETLRFLFESGELVADERGWSSRYDDDTTDYSELPLPPGVKDAVLSRLGGVSPAAWRLLGAASIAGASFTLDDLAPTVALPEWDALEELEGLVRLSVLEATRHGFAFTHDLVRRTVAADLSVERRKLLHRRFAATLEARSGPSAQIAEHLEHADLRAAAVPWRLKAAEDAARVFAYKEAIRHYDVALASEATDDDALAWRLRRTDLLWKLDDHAAREAELRALDTLLSRLPPSNATAASRAEVAMWWGMLHTDAGRTERAMASFDAALAEPGASNDVRSRSLACQGNLLHRMGRLDEATAAYEAALVIDGIDHHRRMGAHDGLAYCALGKGDVEAARLHNAASLALQGHRPSRGRSIAYNTAARIHALSNDMAGALDFLRRAIDDARGIGDVNVLKAFLTNLSQLATENGELDEALGALNEALDLVHAGKDRRGEGVLENRLAHIQLLRGKLGAAVRAFRTAVDIADELGQRDQQVQRRVALARLLCDLGDVNGARTLLGELDARFPGDEPGRVIVEHARVAFLDGHAAHADEGLRALRSTPEYDKPAVKDGARLLSAEVLLALGDRDGALDLVAEDRASPAQQAVVLSVRVRARARPDDLEAARRMLTSPSVPPLEELGLRRAVRDATHLPDPDIDRLADRLAATLPPETRGAFLARHTAAGVVS